jgi:SAM-dependent methyltransferase
VVDAIFSEPRLAELYDPLDPDRSDLDAYVALAAEFNAGTVLDVGCGTGTLACLLAQRGVQVTAADPAAASLAVARCRTRPLAARRRREPASPAGRPGPWRARPSWPRIRLHREPPVLTTGRRASAVNPMAEAGVVVWYNPRCSKCRGAEELLAAYGVPAQRVFYLGKPGLNR